jgi:hypothetical protein
MVTRLHRGFAASSGGSTFNRLVSTLTRGFAASANISAGSLAFGFVSGGFGR